MSLFARVILGSLWLLLPIFSYATDNAQITKHRTIFQQAQYALKTNQISQFDKLRQQLDSYPLQAYLDYLYLRHRLNYVDSDAIAQFLADNRDTFYTDKLRNIWLERLAKNKKWQLFLNQYQDNAYAYKHS